MSCVMRFPFRFQIKTRCGDHTDASPVGGSDVHGVFEESSCECISLRAYQFGIAVIEKTPFLDDLAQDGIHGSEQGIRCKACNRRWNMMFCRNKIPFGRAHDGGYMARRDQGI